MSDVTNVARRGRHEAIDVLPVARRIAAEYGLTPCSDGDLGWVIWNETGFPEFWNIPQDGATPLDCVETQLRRYFVRWADQ